VSLKKEISSAIASHSMWKAHFDACINTGVFDASLETIEMDNECYFGKWLYGDTITAGIRGSEEYKRVKDHHEKFHHIAAKVVKLAMSGNKAEASKLMASNGEYTKVTTQLVMELKNWADKMA
jgi:hypothetical protein